MTSAARHDAFAFYSVASISFLESTVATYVDNLEPFFRRDHDTRRWLHDVWLPEESAHGRLTRDYVARTWPEFDWPRGYARFIAAYGPRCDHALLRPSPALEALARCVTETETAMIYRCLADYTRDAELGAMLRGMSADEVRHYGYFRRIFERYDARERNSTWRKARTLVAHSQLVRDEDVRLAFLPLRRFCPDSYSAAVLKIHPRIVTERLRLRPFVADDAEDLAALAGTSAIADTMLEWPHPFSVGSARSTIAAQAAHYQAGRAIHFALERRDRVGLVGGVELCALDNPHRCAELRFWVAESEWRQGFASEAASAVLRFAFKELRLHRIEAMHLVRCEAAGAVLRKIGMRQEGILRERVRKAGRFEDVALCAVLADEVIVPAG